MGQACEQSSILQRVPPSCFPPSRAEISRLTAQDKRSALLRLQAALLNSCPLLAPVTGLSGPLQEPGPGELVQTLMLWPLRLLGVIQSSASDPGHLVSPASAQETAQANFIACK